ncbi:uncharacterized protein LOC107370655 [Tetranychus urticae]|uniref:Uncharacterized protein n=1 Tax=Tetranychus urticae TaxID=32264 RepID=T1KJH1_TETUR|nr:uncharacterized protein LOC107370655 [Tetranychus urticae]
MKCPSHIIFIFGSFCLTFCLAISLPGFPDIKTIVDKTEQRASKLIEISKMSVEAKAKAHQAKSLLSGLARQLLPKRVEGEKLFLQRNCIAHKFSRQSLSQYYNSMVDHPYQCETLSNGTDTFSRIIGCETESKNFICYGISKTDPLPEPDEDGNACYDVKNPLIPSILNLPKCNCDSIF